MSKNNGGRDKKEEEKKSEKQGKDKKKRSLSIDLDLNLKNPFDSIDFDGIKRPDIKPFEWPGIDKPGFPTLAAGCLGASFAGIGVIKDFIPIKFDDNQMPKIPEIPSIDIFVKGFTGSAVGLPSLKAASIPFPGIGSIPLPDIKGSNVPDVVSYRLDGSRITVPGLDPTVLLKIVGLMIGAPFLIIKGIIETIPSLSPGIPDIPNIFEKAGLGMGIDPKGLGLCIPCLAKGILELIKTVLPI
jgi:hypothetical protein